MVGHQLAPEFKRILAGSIGELVHEALDEHRILIDIDATPEPWWHVRIAHRVVDHQIRHGVTERVLACIEYALKHERVAALLRLHHFRSDRSKNRLTRQPHVQPGEIAAGIESAHQLARRQTLLHRFALDPTSRSDPT